MSVSSSEVAGSFEEGLKRYSVYSPLEIGHILQGLMEAGQPVLLRCAGSQQEAVTAILDVDVTRRVFWVDAPADPALEVLALQVRLFFEGRHNGIAISFATDSAQAARFEGAPAFRVAFPERLTRLQRREFFRVPVLGCAIEVILPAEGKKGRSLLFSVRDISQTGCCLVDPEGALDLFVGKVLPVCSLCLSGTQPLGVRIEVCNAYSVALPDGSGRQQRVGCRFVELEAAKAALIQRYIMQVERKSRSSV